jgi:hypothetical protein
VTETAPFSFGRDKFDSLLNSACSVWKKDSTSTTSYGQPIETFVKLADDVACYAEKTSGKELSVPPAPVSETSTAIETWMIFMRPLSVDDPPVPLNNHHYLQIKKPGDPTLDPNNALSGAVIFNITDVDDPGLAGHHYEVAATVLRP